MVLLSNELIDASYSPHSLWQMRLMLAAISQVPKGGKISHTADLEVRARDMADLAGISARSKSLYGHLKRAADELMAMTITVRKHPDGRTKGKRHWRINVVSQCGYDERKGAVSFQFTHSIIPYVSQLRDRYKTYMLATALKMRTGHGIRLYEWCLRWQFRDVVETTPDAFREWMGLSGRYPAIKDLRRRVLDPAIEDVNEHTDLRISYVQRKRGRRITHFQFTISSDAAGRQLEGGGAGRPVTRPQSAAQVAKADLEDVAAIGDLRRRLVRARRLPDGSAAALDFLALICRGRRLADDLVGWTVAGVNDFPAASDRIAQRDEDAALRLLQEAGTTLGEWAAGAILTPHRALGLSEGDGP